MKTFNVTMNDRILKSFDTREEAQKFMVDFLLVQQMQAESLHYLDEAVLKSDLSEAKEVLSYIMEK